VVKAAGEVGAVDEEAVEAVDEEAVEAVAEAVWEEIGCLMPQTPPLRASALTDAHFGAHHRSR